MSRRGALLAIALVACGDDAGRPVDGGEDGARAVDAALDASLDARVDPSLVILDPAVLHQVDIEIAAEDLELFDVDQTVRVACDVIYDGVVLAQSGCRKKGGIGSVDPALGKPAFSIKLDELVDGQELGGLDKLVLNNALQDPTLLHEHLAYQVFRNAGIPAHRTAFAVVTFNGVPRGVYVVLEPVEKRFLGAAFGEDDDEGNLYEGNIVDFAVEPGSIELKDEVEDGRARDDMLAAAAAVNDSSDDEVAAMVGARIDLDWFARFYAVEIATAGEDGYAFGRNNYYMYHRAADDRFAFLPHGQDTILDNPALEPDYPPFGRLAVRMRGVPALSAAIDDAVAALLAEGGGFALDALEARIDEAVAVVTSTDRDDPFTSGDVAMMTALAPAVKAQLAYRRDWIVGAAAIPACGDGVLHRGEQCDDGDLDAGDGCDDTCHPECVDATAAGASWRFCPARRTWADALVACEAEGGTLVVPADAGEAAMLADAWRTRFASTDAWTAVTDGETCEVLDTGLAGGPRSQACDAEYGAICRILS